LVVFYYYGIYFTQVLVAGGLILWTLIYTLLSWVSYYSLRFFFIKGALLFKKF
jgi:hypothetical protein